MTTYNSEYFAKLAEIEHEHFWFRARNRVIAALVRQVTETLPAGFRVLEVGCGTGNVLQVIEQACPRGLVVGMDLYAEGLRFARRRTSCLLVQGDIHKLPFRSPFDVIGAFDVLEHLPDDHRVLRDLRAILAPGGALLLTVPAHASLWSYFDEASHHCRRYSREELHARLVETGYQVEFLSEFMSSIYPLVWLGRRLAARFRKPRESGAAIHDELATSELRVIPGLNGVLSFLLGQEARVLARRRRLPLGTSLVAVARNASSV